MIAADFNLATDVDFVAHMMSRETEEIIIPLFGHLGKNDIKTKSHTQDFATIADTRTEDAYRLNLTAKFPGYHFVGEEGVFAGKDSKAVLQDLTAKTFIADPLDGTTNFTRQLLIYGSIMALVDKGETIVGWVYDIPGRRHFIAVKGHGAFMLNKDYEGSYKDGVRLHVAQNKDLADPDLRGFIQPFHFKGAARTFLEAQINERLRTIHCSAHEYINVAMGQADFSFNTHMNQWDHLAGALLVQEAGGVVEKFDGSAYKPWDESGGIVVSSHADLTSQIQRQLIQPALALALSA